MRANLKVDGVVSGFTSEGEAPNPVMMQLKLDDGTAHSPIVQISLNRAALELSWEEFSKRYLQPAFAQLVNSWRYHNSVQR
jgi:hypothetical protein